MTLPMSSRSRSLVDRFFTYLDARSPSDRFLFAVTALVLITSVIWTLFSYNQSQLIAVPGSGGTLVEGVVGAPRFVNPVLAITRVDQDLSALLYNGLLRIEPDGTLGNELAESVTVSDDGTVYSVVLRDDIFFNDGARITTADVVFTIGLIQDPEIKSPLRGSWNDVEIELINDRELNFVLEEAYVPFIENLTVGILPKHVWGDLSNEEFPFSQFNTRPVGSGLYAVTDVARTNAGLISSYTLSARTDTGRPPLISTIRMVFFSNEAALAQALEDGEVMSTGSLSTDHITSLDPATFTVHSNPLPRVFGVFLNPNRGAVVRDEAVREALTLMIDRETLIDEVLGGYGEPITSPVPIGFLEFSASNTPTVATSTAASSTLERARAILIAGNWEETSTGAWQKEIDDETVRLAFTLTTANNELFAETAAYLESVWTTLGAEVSVALFEQADLVQAVIRPRDYQMLLFGTDVGRAVDLYPFWHSSQREDPGLNVGLYTNITTDALLEDYRISQSETDRTELLNQFISEIQIENPAFFLYNPSFVYVTKNGISIETIAKMERPSDRFTTIDRWYLHEEQVWPFFTKYVRNN